MVIGVVALPISFYVFFNRNFQKLGEASTKQRFGGLYDSLKTNERKSLNYNMSFVLRRLVFCFSIAFLDSFPFL